MIKGLSDKRRLPRAGIIRLGIKVKNEAGKEYPKETDFFVCPPLVKEQYGDEPKEMVIMFPVESEQVFFQQFYKKYGNGVLLCRGDGEKATYYDFDEGGFVDKECPCDDLDKKCKAVGVLQFLLPEIREAVGVWQISTSSKNSIIDINSGIDFVRGLVGRIAMIPLILKREETKTQKIEGAKVIKGRHYTMKLSIGMSLMEIQKRGLISPTQALLPAPVETQESVDDLFPPNGFDKKEKSPELEKGADDEKENTEKAALYLSDLTSRKKELSGILEKIYKTDRKIKEGEAVKLDALVTVREYRGAIKYWNNVLESLKTDPA